MSGNSAQVLRLPQVINEKAHVKDVMAVLSQRDKRRGQEAHISHDIDGEDLILPQINGTNSSIRLNRAAASLAPRIEEPSQGTPRMEAEITQAGGTSALTGHTAQAAARSRRRRQRTARPVDGDSDKKGSAWLEQVKTQTERLRKEQAKRQTEEYKGLHKHSGGLLGIDLGQSGRSEAANFEAGFGAGVGFGGGVGVGGAFSIEGPIDFHHPRMQQHDTKQYNQHIRQPPGDDTDLLAQRARNRRAEQKHKELAQWRTHKQELDEKQRQIDRQNQKQDRWDFM
jgi:hypothetical protein